MGKKRPKKGPSSISYRPKPDVEQALREYRDGLEVTPALAAIVDRAVRLYLREKGFDVAEKPSEEAEDDGL